MEFILKAICPPAVGKLTHTVSELIQWTLHTIEMWCHELGLSVNLDQTGLVAFTRRRKLPGFFEPRLFWNDFTPLYVSQVSLGSLVFSADLEQHVDVEVRKAHNLLWASRRAYGVPWG